MPPESDNPPARNPEETARFINAGNGVVMDAARKLLWVKLDTWQLTGKWMSWVHARDYSEELNRKKYGGFQDWRIPSVADAKSLFDKNQENKDHMGQLVFHAAIFPPGFGFLYWTSDVRNKIQAVRFSFRKGISIFDDVYRTSRGSTRFVRDVGKEDGLL